MKKLLYLGLLFLSIQVAQAQTPTAPTGSQVAASRDDDTMVLALSGTSEQTWRRLGQVLVQRGYSIQHSDNSLFTITTNGVFKRGIGVVAVAGTVLNDQVLVRVYWGGSADTGGGQPALSRRKNGERWAELVAIGQAFGGPVSYTTTVPD